MTITNLANALHSLIVLAAGVGIGLAFFGGLWWTVQQLGRGSRATWFFPLSSLTRTAVLLAACWWVADGGLVRLALFLCGYVIARHFMIQHCAPATAKGGGACT